MKVYKCDRCEKYVDTGQSYIVEIDGYPSFRCELCPECHEKLEHFLTTKENKNDSNQNSPKS